MTAPARHRPREGVEGKARRLLAEGRVTVTHLDGERIDATCQGTDHTWRLGWRRDRGGWWCACPARSFGRRCSHLTALMLVTARPSGTKAPERHGDGSGVP
jgi:uncharacterized Zn finger protein